LSLCNGNGELNPKKLSYIGSPIHRIVKDGWLQLGDIKDGSGLYGESIYGDTFPDEGFEVKHNVEGILSMANKGPHTNGSQFLITMRPLPSFDNKFVAFGRVVSGLDHIRKINAVPTLNQRPQAKIFISKANECHATRLLLNTVNVTDHQQFNSPRSINRKAATLICLGLDGAGKSTVTMNFDQHMAKDAFYAYATVGFEMEQVPYDHFDLTFFGLGGGRSFRSIWAHYFDEIFGLVYVVDSTDEKRMEESRDALSSIFKHPGMEGKPVLIYANKQDGRGAMSAPEVAHFFDVDELNKTRKVRVFGSTALPSAYHSSCKESDPKLYEGMSWLCLAIENNYTALADKVDADMAAAKAKK
jgi:small GTP-binding protein